jgi:hypothetical protein
MSCAIHGHAAATDDFVDLVCADPLLLDAAFEALIAEAWPDDTPTPPGGTARTRVGAADRPPGRRSSVNAVSRTDVRARGANPRADERSPPR